MGDGKEGRPRGAVRKLLEDRYHLDVEWCAAHESFASVATDPDGFNVAMPAGVQEFIDSLWNDPEALIPHNGMTEHSLEGLTDSLILYEA